MTEIAYLLRHGDYESSHNGDKLTALGIEQSQAARDDLIARKLGSRVYLLASDAPRALETATIISAGLDTPVLLSTQVRHGSLHSDAVGALGEFLRQSLQIDAGEEAESDVPFVIVCHAPLVAAFTGHAVANDVEKGRVYPVSAERQNPEYKPDLAEFILTGGLER